MKKMKTLTEWENIFANHIFDKEIAPRIYKELLQLDSKKTNSSRLGKEEFPLWFSGNELN